MAKGRKTGGGSRAGVPNRMTATLREMILAALDQAGGDGGGQAYLARQAEENPAVFMALVGKILPLPETGEGGGALVIRWQRESDPED
jgi:hypothetical protein